MATKVLGTCCGGFILIKGNGKVDGGFVDESSPLLPLPTLYLAPETSTGNVVLSPEQIAIKKLSELPIAAADNTTYIAGIKKDGDGNFYNILISFDGFADSENHDVLLPFVGDGTKSKTVPVGFIVEEIVYNTQAYTKNDFTQSGNVVTLNENMPPFTGEVVFHMREGTPPISVGFPYTFPLTFEGASSPDTFAAQFDITL